MQFVFLDEVEGLWQLTIEVAGVQGGKVVWVRSGWPREGALQYSWLSTHLLDAERWHITIRRQQAIAVH